MDMRTELVLLQIEKVVKFCDAKMVETLKDSYPSYQEYRTAEVNLQMEQLVCRDILNLMNRDA